MENKEDKDKVKVEVSDSGPLKITGNFILMDLKRNFVDSPDEILLCRCGRSQNKPFCDCSHKK